MTTDIARLVSDLREGAELVRERYDAWEDEVFDKAADAITALLTELETTRAQVEGMRTALEGIAVMLAPGNRNLDEMLRDMMYACDRARHAVALSPTPAEKA
jgi:hypothetical protein